MPRRTDLHRILVVGSGPIVIGQACEFDYSGTQAVKALEADGFEVVLINSNPATIMTDPELAHRTYVEPLTPEYLEAVLERERPDAILPTVGGQTALNLTMEVARRGALERLGVEVIGASVGAIELAEDRQKFSRAMEEIGLEVPKSVVVSSAEEARAFAAENGFPVVVRPSFTLGGSGGGIAYNADELDEICRRGLELSPVHEVQIDESLVGWKEYELEVMRDLNDNVVIICSIENVDPMGVHTGDSITVAPAQTLTDREYQRMRDAAIAILRKVAVDTGGSNVQFAVSPKDGRLVVIEMNPRVSRSSALASKATGFPIAKVAAKLAVGYTLDEIPNDITKKTPAAFEPTVDYVVTKIPKFAFEKFPGADEILGTQMKSVGEVMAIGRTFKESLFKALRSLEAVQPHRYPPMDEPEIAALLGRPHEDRLRIVVLALELGWTVEAVARLTHFDPWFLDQIRQFAILQRSLRGRALASIDDATLRRAKEMGFSDRRIAYLSDATRGEVAARRAAASIQPVYKRVDTCAAEFESHTPYLYSTYEEECEAEPTDGPKVMILGSGPNRIGQGLEFDYCCCHASFALREDGVQSIMVNCNPETVSTDYDTSDRLYFEPLTLEDTLEIIAKEKPDGVIVQFGGQTPLNLTKPLAEAGVKILGTQPESIDLAEDRERFNRFLGELSIRYPEHGFARTREEAAAVARELGYPVLVRPSFVLGGRAMAVVYGEDELSGFVNAAFDAAPEGGALLLDRFLEGALEVDVDALCDGERCVIAGVMQHVEEAGVHSGDSCCVLPPVGIPEPLLQQIRETTRRMARALGVVGLMNTQYAICDGELYVLEVNPRASRTVPFVAKATGVPLAKIATRLMMGKTLEELGLVDDLDVPQFFVKAPVFPFAKFLGVDPKLSPEMRSTGEVMGASETLGVAYYKAQLSAGLRLPSSGTAFVSVNPQDHAQVVPIAKQLSELGFTLIATSGTARTLREAGLEVSEVLKRSEGRPNVVDAIKSGEVALIVNTPLGHTSVLDGWAIRTAAVQHNVPCITTLAGARAAVEAIATLAHHATDVRSLQELHGGHASRA
ncbi:MAG: carbamoyl-phosphate synthase large subunit [Sandaracinaceae bacterium]|nr:carbamoyl-phosphate synthase large subunit [Sandaracinaceae bacterium]